MSFAFKKPKINKERLLSIMLLILMLGSTFAYSVLRSYNLNTNEEKEIELPEENVINYKLTNEQKNYLIRQGKTNIEYTYPMGCSFCTKKKSYLESLAEEFSDQIYLEEIINNYRETSKISITSYYKTTNLENATKEEIFNTLCISMVNPPVRCATRNI